MNGKPGDNPLSDMISHGAHPFPDDIEKMLLEIDAIGREQGWWPLGENLAVLTRRVRMGAWGRSRPGPEPPVPPAGDDASGSR